VKETFIVLNVSVVLVAGFAFCRLGTKIVSDLSRLLQGVCGMVEMLLRSLVHDLFCVSKTTYLLALGSCWACLSLIFRELLICVLVLLNFPVFVS